MTRGQVLGPLVFRSMKRYRVWAWSVSKTPLGIVSHGAFPKDYTACILSGRVRVKVICRVLSLQNLKNWFNVKRF